MLLYKGNYGDLVALLGQELPQDQMSDEQKFLRHICQKMNFNQVWSCQPCWTSGAHVFVTPEIASEIQSASLGELHKGHIIVSKSYLQIVTRVLSSQRPSESSMHNNRGAKQPKLKEQKDIPLAALSFVGAAEIRLSLAYTFPSAKVGDAYSTSTRRTHTTGSRPRSQPAAGRSYGPERKNFRLCKYPNPVTSLAASCAQPSSSESGECGVDQGGAGNNDDDGSLGGLTRSGERGAGEGNLEETMHSGEASTDIPTKHGDSVDASRAEVVLANGEGLNDEAGAGDLDFFDARSEMSAYTCETSLTVNSETTEDVLTFILARVNDAFWADGSVGDAYAAERQEWGKTVLAWKRLVETGETDLSVQNMPGDEPTRSAHIARRMHIFSDEVVPTILCSDQLANKIASLASSPSVNLEHAKVGQDHLAEIVRLCCSKQVLRAVLQIDLNRAQSLVTELKSILRSAFKNAYRKQRINLKKVMSQKGRPESLHEVADLLRDMVVQAFQDAVSEIDTIAWEVLQEKIPGRLQPPLKGTWKQERRHATELENETRWEQRRIMEREDIRRANKLAKWNGPSTQVYSVPPRK